MEGAGIFLVLLWVAFVALWIWAIVDCVRVPDDRYYRAGSKVVWILVIVLLGLIGVIIYFAAGRPDQATRATMASGGGRGDPPLPPPSSPGSLPPPPN